MIELAIFIVVLIIAMVVSIWYTFHRQAVYDEMMESIRQSLETIADCSVDVSVALDTLDIESGDSV